MISLAEFGTGPIIIYPPPTGQPPSVRLPDGNWTPGSSMDQWSKRTATRLIRLLRRWRYERKHQGRGPRTRKGRHNRHHRVGGIRR